MKKLMILLTVAVSFIGLLLKQSNHFFEMPPGPQPALAAMATEQKIEVVGHIGGQFSGLAAQGNYTYVAQNVELAIIDVSQPSQPKQVGSLILGASIGAVAVQGNYVYIATSANLYVVDVSNPNNPINVGSTQLSETETSYQPFHIEVTSTLT